MPILTVVKSMLQPESVEHTKSKVIKCNLDYNFDIKLYPESQQIEIYTLDFTGTLIL